MATKFVCNAARSLVNAKPRMVLIASAAFLAAVGAVGCNGGDNRGEVSGRVTYKGRPVSEGTLIFSNPAMGVFITAPLSSDGSYRVETAKGFGLPPAAYQVAVVPPSFELPVGLTKETPRIKPCRNIPERYRKSETSGLSVVVSPKGARFDVEMNPREQ
jgi:hypothetical protein